MPPAILFDMDGVLSDTQVLHSTCESIILARYGISLTPESLAFKYAGVPDEVFFAEVLEEHKIFDRDVDQVVEEKWDLLKETVSRRGIPAIPHAAELANTFKAKKLPLAVASGSPLWFIQKVVEALKLSDTLITLVSADEVPRGKPAPDVFLEAARRLKVDPASCIVIEDGMSGMHGAVAAGMKCIGYVSDKNKDWPAHVLVNSLAEIDDELIAKLVG